jgi:glycosyltransferase 2 family protein
LVAKIKKGLQVSLSLMVALWLFNFLNKDISWQELKAAIQNISIPWMTASIFIAVLGYWIRAWRWKLLLNVSEEKEKHVATKTAFFALIFGYLINLLVPRAGELARCAFLNKSNQLPIGNSLGTVILERTIDLLFFLLTIFLAFFIENQMFLKLSEELISISYLKEKISNSLPVLLITSIGIILLIWVLKRRMKNTKVWKKISGFVSSLQSGLNSVFQLKNQWGFWGASIAIWVIYYLTLVFVALSFESTANLSLPSIFVVMVMGTIGMIAPVQGGIGTFHALVAYILTAYGLSEIEGKIYAIIIHGSQTITLIGLGLVSLVVLFKITSRSKQ